MAIKRRMGMKNEMNETEQYLREVLYYDPKAIVKAFEHDIKENTYKQMKKENIIPMIEALLNEEETVIEDDLQGIPPVITLHCDMEDGDLQTGKLLILHLHNNNRI